MKLKINVCTLLLTINVQSQLDHLFWHLFSLLFKACFNHTIIHQVYLISLLERNLFGVLLRKG